MSPLLSYHDSNHPLDYWILMNEHIGLWKQKIVSRHISKITHGDEKLSHESWKLPMKLTTILIAMIIPITVIIAIINVILHRLLQNYSLIHIEYL
ncbi:hypothetical protein V1477_021090 [Vespula maculifrons]|uniref:Uncharacterized protein n=1 Tax=Vespula maculifrons TaxID=7453 RepID=A0ABD2AH53_VESMC